MTISYNFTAKYVKYNFQI